MDNYACVHKSSKYAKRKKIVQQDLVEGNTYTFLNTNIYCGMDEEGVPTQYFSDFTTLKRLLKGNKGIGIIKKPEFDYYFGPNSREYLLLPMESGLKINCVAVCRPQKENEAVGRLMEFLRETI